MNWNADTMPHARRRCANSEFLVHVGFRGILYPTQSGIVGSLFSHSSIARNNHLITSDSFLCFIQKDICLATLLAINLLYNI